MPLYLSFRLMKHFSGKKNQVLWLTMKSGPLARHALASLDRDTLKLPNVGF